MEFYCTLRKVLEQKRCGNHPFLCDFVPGFYYAESMKVAMEVDSLGETNGPLQLAAHLSRGPAYSRQRFQLEVR